MTGMTPRWLLCRRRRPDARVRLYCFPHSGGSPAEYMRWSDWLPSEVEVWGVQLPGRGSRVGEQPATSLHDLVRSLVAEAEFSGPYVFFGHSLGAPIAYETALALRDASGREPEMLIVSAYGAPHLHRPGISLEEISSTDFMRKIEALYGPVPPALAQDPMQSDRYIAILAADLTMAATYEYAPAHPLSCPIIALSGDTDRETDARLSAWSSHTSGPATVQILPGGHFYYRETPEGFARHLREALGRLRVQACPPQPNPETR